MVKVGAIDRPLRVLVAHNRYLYAGGEDSVVEAEIGLLRQYGHEVSEYSRTNHDLESISEFDAALQTMWSKRTANEVNDIMLRSRPDILHVHNTFPLISPSIYWVAERHRVPIVQTLHNFRLICPQGLMLRNDRPCEDCVGRVPIPAVVHGCYRGSRSQTFVLAAMVAGHRAARTWSRRVARYIALNDFCRDRFIAGGLPAARISVKPNFVDLPPPNLQERHGFLFVGRLSIEKGVDVIAGALSKRTFSEPVRIVGIGPKLSVISGVAGAELLGELRPDAVYEEMRRSRALVLPSIWYENFPRTLVEAFACGLPVIASRLGAMAALIKDGVTGILFEPGDPTDLSNKMQWCLDNPEKLKKMSVFARDAYESELTSNKNYHQLMKIYAEATAELG